MGSSTKSSIKEPEYSLRMKLVKTTFGNFKTASGKSREAIWCCKVVKLAFLHSEAHDILQRLLEKIQKKVKP
jgi:hypothetical protein